MGISKYAKATYGWCVNWSMIETETVTEVPNCVHQLSTNEDDDWHLYCPFCGTALGFKKEYSRSYTDIVEEVPEEDIDGYYVTCKGYPVYKKDKEYQDEEDLAYIGITIGEGESCSFPDDDVYDMARALSPIFGPGPTLFVWTEYC